MQANSFFLRRAVARPATWQLRYPALALASATDFVEEPRKQIVVAAADQDCIRMVFFSSLGSVLDLHTTWDDLARARQWLDFTLRWNRWWLPDPSTLETVTRFTREPSDTWLANRPIRGDITDDASFCEYIDVVKRISPGRFDLEGAVSCRRRLRERSCLTTFHPERR
jgi:hypothetical protein